MAAAVAAEKGTITSGDIVTAYHFDLSSLSNQFCPLYNSEIRQIQFLIASADDVLCAFGIFL